MPARHDNKELKEKRRQSKRQASNGNPRTLSSSSRTTGISRHDI